MGTDDLLNDLERRLGDLEADGLYKRERVIASPQDAHITLDDGSTVLNLCSNNYLGLADDPTLVAAATAALEDRGLGMASVRFICGTQDGHRILERRIADHVGSEEAILYSSCFDANTGLFETILDDQDAIISDALNHASIIDGVRLSKARRLRYDNNDMASLEARLREAADARYRLIATDGVFSMDGVIADLPGICELADEYDALVMVDDSHAVGFVGENGGGTPELTQTADRVDIVTGTFGKALGGASGGFTASHAPIVEWLRQRSRPYLFSNSLAPAIVGATLAALDIVAGSRTQRERLAANAHHFRTAMEAAGFTLAGNGHPIIPVMIGDAPTAVQMADALLDEGVYVIAFSYPVVPEGSARIRTQMSASHTPDDIDEAVAAFIRVGEQLGVLAT